MIHISEIWIISLANTIEAGRRRKKERNTRPHNFISMKNISVL
jgi:hypothetical protein